MIDWINEGDIFTLKEVKNYAHGCNCAGVMGKGIALQFKIKFPLMYVKYKKKCSEGKFNLGDVYEYNYGDGYIYNLGTQSSWRTKAKIEAVEFSMRKMLDLASRKGVNAIALPKIGAGLGGLKWQDVKDVIEKMSSEFPNIRLLVVENYRKN